MTGYHRLAADRGMTVDGDVLADCIAEACPDVLTVEASREVAEKALRIAHATGMTVLRGPGSRPWTPAGKDAMTEQPPWGGKRVDEMTDDEKLAAMLADTPAYMAQARAEALPKAREEVERRMARAERRREEERAERPTYRQRLKERLRRKW